MRITQGGLVGISNTSPIAKLDVVGTISASDAIQIGASILTCASSISGSIRWGNASNTLQICAGTGWVSLASGTLGNASVAGSNMQVQYNDNGTMNASVNFAFISGTSSISTTRVSSTLVSSTYVQISSATTILSCATALTGTMRYTSGTMQVCDGSNWGNIGIGVPTGTIMAFEAASCPSGWTEYTAARGRFLRGIDNSAGNDPSGTRTAGGTQTDAFGSHRHLSGVERIHDSATGPYGDVAYGSTSYQLSRYAGSANYDIDYTESVGATETRPKNVAVTFCRYDGYASGNYGSTSSTVAGSTGQVQYNTSSALDASANFTWTNASSLLTIAGTASTTA